MTQGWFTGLIPITVPIAAASFGDAAWAAQASFDNSLDMAKVPYYRVLELAPWLRWPQSNFPVSNFFHGGASSTPFLPPPTWDLRTTSGSTPTAAIRIN